MIKTLNTYIDNFNMDVMASNPMVVTTTLADSTWDTVKSERQVHGRKATATKPIF